MNRRLEEFLERLQQAADLSSLQNVIIDLREIYDEALEIYDTLAAHRLKVEA